MMAYLIDTGTMTYIATLAEDDLRTRLAHEVIEQLGLMGDTRPTSCARRSTTRSPSATRPAIKVGLWVHMPTMITAVRAKARGLALPDR